MADEDGERREPVEPGELREGDEVVRTTTERGLIIGWEEIEGTELLYPELEVHESDTTWQRVAKDPPLPTTPGTVIRCDYQIRGGDGGTNAVAELFPGSDDTGPYWGIAGESYAVLPDEITRVLYVYPEPGGQRA